jgi:predicted DNA-binding protein
MAAKEISVKKYVVRLSGEERERLEALLRKGKRPGATHAEGADIVEGRRLGSR